MAEALQLLNTMIGVGNKIGIPTLLVAIGTIRTREPILSTEPDTIKIIRVLEVARDQVFLHLHADHLIADQILADHEVDLPEVDLLGDQRVPEVTIKQVSIK